MKILTADFPPLLNREFSLLEFNRRVLALAEDVRIPVLERLKYVCIVSSNMDEFFEVRVATIKEQLQLNPEHIAPDGLTPAQALNKIQAAAQQLIHRQYQVFNQQLIPALNAEGIYFLRRNAWTKEQAAWIEDYFYREVMPVLTPIGLDPAHPFPRLLNKSLNFAIELEGLDAFGRSSGIAIVQAPRVLPRVIRLPEAITASPYSFVFLSSILHSHVSALFSGMEIKGCYQFRVTRNSDLFFDEEEVKNLRTALQGELPQRNFGDAVRLEIADNCPVSMAQFLLSQFQLSEADLYRVEGPVNLVRLLSVPDEVARPELKFIPFTARIPDILRQNKDIFATLRQQDVLLHLPYESFTPVINFIQQAALDHDVVAIKQTVYRTGNDSVLMEALLEAAQRGKEVTVVVELLARFDEQTNINWAAKLEEAGAHVVYGVFGYKTHAKMAMVVRRESSGLRRYVHMSTGNYHPRTARFYTDFGLFTANSDICADVHQVFTQLTGLGQAGSLKYIWQSPFSLHQNLLAAIEQEATWARQGYTARIIAKMNSLLEPEIIHALYRASQAGVKIDLIIRGVCALRPGIVGVSENIRVRSVVGRFLEHPRIFYFKNRRHYDVYLSSADWMDRNFFRRIEICFPILDLQLKKRVISEGLYYYLRDNCQAFEMDSQGYYRRKMPRQQISNAQQRLLDELTS